MNKEDLFSKLNIKDYNNQLEDILEKKSFSEGAKNILLNILYKMETAYEDYNKVKVDTELKKDILEEIIQIIEKRCKEIELIKPKLNEKTKLGDKKFIAEKNKITSFPNEKTVFYALYHLQEKSFIISKKNNILSEPMEKVLNNGYIMEREELIRDFDGWAWNITKNEIENYTMNIVYQNIKLLVGDKFLQDYKKNNNNADFIEKLERKINSIYTEEISNIILEQIYIISILENIKENKQKQKKLLDEKSNLEKDLKEIKNKETYLQEIADNKKLVAKQIKEIDKIVNNNMLLREKFSEKNKELSEKEKIFSLSEYVEMLQTKREELLIALKEYANLMKPMNYVKNKSNLQKQVDLLEKIDFNNIEDEHSNILEELQVNILNAIQEKIAKIETKKKLIEYIYIFRYYKLLYINEEKQIKNVEKIKEQLVMAEKYLITRACNLKAINILSNNIEKNYEIVSEVLNSNIIDLDEVNLEFKKKDNKIVLNIYDDNVIDKIIEYEEKINLNVKFNKKIRLFI